MYSTQRKSAIESLVYFVIYTLIIGIIAFGAGYVIHESSQASIKDSDVPTNLSFYRRSADGTLWVNDPEQNWICFEYNDYKTHVLELIKNQGSPGPASPSHERNFP